MCDGDGEGPAVWSSRWRRARIPHACTACPAPSGKTILPGDLYWSWSGLWDGLWGRGKHCATCHAIYEFLDEINDDPVDLALDCGETLDDPTDPANALAFWTRDDGQLYAEWSADQRKNHHAI